MSINHKNKPCDSHSWDIAWLVDHTVLCVYCIHKDVEECHEVPQLAYTRCMCYKCVVSLLGWSLGIEHKALRDTAARTQKSLKASTQPTAEGAGQCIGMSRSFSFDRTYRTRLGHVLTAFIIRTFLKKYILFLSPLWCAYFSHLLDNRSP